jgi:hypothetical protein
MLTNRKYSTTREPTFQEPRKTAAIMGDSQLIKKPTRDGATMNVVKSMLLNMEFIPDGEGKEAKMKSISSAVLYLHTCPVQLSAVTSLRQAL